MYSYGQRLNEIRKSLRLSQEEMAQKLCIAPRTYAAYERDENKPPLNLLHMLHLNFDIDLNWFVTGNGAMVVPKAHSKIPPSLRDEIKKAVLEMVKNGELTVNDF